MSVELSTKGAKWAVSVELSTKGAKWAVSVELSTKGARTCIAKCQRLSVYMFRRPP